MARQFKTEHEARMAKYIEPDITEINGEKVTTISGTLEINSDGNYEWYSIVDTWVTSYLCTEDGEVLEELYEHIPDDNAPCDDYGMLACTTSCPYYIQCQTA